MTSDRRSSGCRNLIMPDIADMKAALLAMLSDGDVRATLRELLGVEEKEREIAELKEQVSAQRVMISEQEQRLADLEQYSRRNCLNFTGVPENKDENVVQLAIDLAKMANVKLDRIDIDRVHRVGKPRAAPNAPGHNGASPRPLVVKFVSYLKREAVWFGRKEMRQAKPPRGSTIAEGSLKNAYIQENLTRKNQEVMYLARQLKRAGKLWAVWSDGCILKVKKTQQTPTIRLNSKDDLRQFE